MNHVDLFSGIGGFALAASWCGIDTAQFVEIDERCRAFLAKRWPGVPIHDDIRTFDGTQHRGAFLLTGGVPCQPSSRAGKQRGKDDDRWLWPEAIRVLSEVRPTWAIFENPPGIGDVGLAGILAEMESVGYQMRVFGVPACAVGAPQIRERSYIIASDTKRTRRERRVEEFGVSCSEGEARPEYSHGMFASWDSMVAHLGGLPTRDGLSVGMESFAIHAYGNSIVPQVAYQIIKAMIQAEQEIT